MMKITHVVLLFTLFGHTNARIIGDGVEQDQRALGNGYGNNGNGNGNNGSGNGNGGNTGVISNPDDTGGPSGLDEDPAPRSSPPLPGLQSDTAPQLVSDFAAGDDDDEVDILVTFKNNNGKAKAKGKAKKINHELRLGDIVAMTATKKEIRELALDADIE
jgi:hypothetical protein